MDLKAIYEYCKNLGCCDLCCIRYMGIKSTYFYGDYKKFLSKYQNEPKSDENSDNDNKCVNEEVKDNLPEAEIQIEKSEENSNNTEKSLDQEVKNDLPNDEIKNNENGAVSENPNGLSPPAKKRKMNVCCSCLGILQEENWQESCDMVKESLDKKKYVTHSFACALSAPIATLLRERAITLRLEEKFPGYEHKTLSILKEAWKWTYGVRLGAHINKSLDSGAISPLLVTVHMDYADDLKELEILKSVSPQLFEERNKQKRRFATEFTRRSVEQALEKATLRELLSSSPRGEGGLPAPRQRAACRSVVCLHSPAYLAGSSGRISDAGSFRNTEDGENDTDESDDDDKPTIAAKANRLAEIKKDIAKKLLKSCRMLSDESWNSPGRSQDPTVAPPSDPEGRNEARKKKGNRKRKVDALTLYFMEAKENARDNPSERRLLLQRYRAITLRLRAEELKLQAEWLKFMGESMNVINNIIARNRNQNNNDDSDDGGDRGDRGGND